MEKRKRRLGDRKDGRKLRTLAPYETMSPYFMGRIYNTSATHPNKIKK